MTDLKLTREEQFILNCLRTEFGREDKSIFASFDLPSMNWDTVYKKSVEWKIAPLLYTIIKKQSRLLQTIKIQEYFLERMKLKYMMSRVAYDAIRKSLSEVLETFHKAGIKVILLKGSHLAQFVYQDVGVRPMGDIDILVRKEDLSKAEEVLLHMGYDNKHKTKSSLHLPYFIHPEGKAPLEVHWTITNPIWRFNVDMEGISERAKTVRKHGIDMLVFSPEDLLLYLSLHAVYQHNLRALGLVPYCDIATIIHNTANHEQIPHKNMSSWKQGGGEGGCEQTHNDKEVFAHEYNRHLSELDWDKLHYRAHEWGIEKYLCLALRLSHELLGVCVPDRISKAFQAEPLNEKIVSEAKNRILSVKSEESVFANVPHLFYGGFHPNNRLAKRILFVFQTIFVLPEELAVYYALPETSQRVYFYYPVRLASLLYRFILHYSKFIIYRLTHRNEQVYGENLDLWILNPKP